LANHLLFAMSSSSSSANDKDKEDLDIFLTTIESKLRGPFSSLDLAKSVTTSALRGSLTPPQYLQNLNLVLLRTDKVSQLRILIGLLGLDPEPQIDEQLVNILETAQQNSDEPWVRTIAGLIQGILFKDEEDSSRKSCRGEVAEELLTKTCEDICQRILKIHQMSKKEDACQPDLNAYFVPYRYSLISANLLQETKIHELGNPHFQVNQDAAILKIDEQLEAQRAKEAQEHASLPFRQGNASASSTNNSSTATGSNLPPGFKPTNLVQKAKPSSSMFVTRPNLAAKKAQLANRAKLMRRKGGAQSLLSGTNYKSHTASGAVADKTADAGPTKLMVASRTEPTTRAAAVPRGRFSSGKSKMKMLDVDTVSNLHQQTMQRKQEEALSKISKKRRIMEAAKQQGLKKTKHEQTPPEQQQQQESNSPRKPKAAPSTEAPPAPQAQAPTPHQQQSEQEWKVLLRERSNKLSDEDRSRVQQFFENQYNPTSEQPIHKMKLHEQRTVDSTTGKNIKETFYLELDYQKNTSKQSKKIKRY
jgi:hypothetical protein